MEDIYQIICFVFIVAGLFLANQVEDNNIDKKYLVYWAYVAFFVLFFIYTKSFHIIGKEYT